MGFDLVFFINELTHLWNDFFSHHCNVSWNKLTENSNHVYSCIVALILIMDITAYFSQMKELLNHLKSHKMLLFFFFLFSFTLLELVSSVASVNLISSMYRSVLTKSMLVEPLSFILGDGWLAHTGLWNLSEPIWKKKRRSRVLMKSWTTAQTPKLIASSEHRCPFLKSGPCKWNV